MRHDIASDRLGYSPRKQLGDLIQKGAISTPRTFPQKKLDFHNKTRYYTNMSKRAEVEQTIRTTNSFLPQIGKGTGWMPEPEDPRDFRLSSIIPKQTATPQKASLAQFTPPIRDQGSQGSCVGFSTAYGVGLLRRKESDGPGEYKTIYSPQFIYNLAREKIGELHVDYGAYIRDGVGVVRKVGAATEKSFMYYEIEDIMHKLPPKPAYESARSWRLGAHYACNNIDDIRKAISSGFPVVLGFLCFTNIGSSWQTGYIKLPNTGDRISGGHAVLVDSYDDTTRTISGPNSWGKAWGDKGRFHLPYEYCEKGYCMDMWAMQGEAEETKFPRVGK